MLDRPIAPGASPSSPNLEDNHGILGAQAMPLEPFPHLEALDLADLVHEALVLRVGTQRSHDLEGLFHPVQMVPVWNFHRVGDEESETGHYRAAHHGMAVHEPGHRPEVGIVAAEHDDHVGLFSAQQAHEAEEGPEGLVVDDRLVGVRVVADERGASAVGDDDDGGLPVGLLEGADGDAVGEGVSDAGGAEDKDGLQFARLELARGGLPDPCERAEHCEGDEEDKPIEHAILILAKMVQAASSVDEADGRRVHKNIGRPASRDSDGGPPCRRPRRRKTDGDTPSLQSQFERGGARSIVPVRS